MGRIGARERFQQQPADARHADVAAYDIGLLLLRLIPGVIMIAHGTQKLCGWFGGYGLRATGQFFTVGGYPAGHVMAVIGGLAEALGGLGLIVGFSSRRPRPLSSATCSTPSQSSGAASFSRPPATSTSCCARSGHPVEDHLIPLTVAVGAAEGDPATRVCHETAFMNHLTSAGYRFG